MATRLQNPGQVGTGPGNIYIAPIGTALPTFAVTAGAFTMDWDDWIPVGYTDDGLTTASGKTVEGVEVAEELEPIRYQTTGGSTTVSFSPAGLNETNVSLAFNGGTWSTVSGTAGTLIRKFTPPAIGSEVRKMIGFQRADNALIIIWYQCLQASEATQAFQKGTAKNSLTGLQFQVEQPDPLVATTKLNYWTAGATFAATAAI